MSNEKEDDPWGEPDVREKDVVCLLQKHFPEAEEAQVEPEAAKLHFMRSIAAVSQTLDRSNKPIKSDLDDLHKALNALKKAEKHIRGLGLAGGNALGEAAHQTITFTGDPSGDWWPNAADATRILAERVCDLITGLQSAVETLDESDATPSQRGRPTNIEATEFADALCQCFERLSGKAAKLSTNNATGEKSGRCLCFVKEAFALYGVKGSEQDLVRAYSRRGKTPKKN
jgi:hypothetical protein